MARKARSSESYALKYAPYFSIAGFDHTICDFRTIVQTIRQHTPYSGQDSKRVRSVSTLVSLQLSILGPAYVLLYG